jgi:K(+)-stimulated pyrophosphate-energized sodium pump
MNFDYWIYIGIGAGLISIGVALYLFFWVKRQNAGSEKAQEVASWIKEGAASYLKRLYTALTIVAVILGVIIALVFSLVNTETGVPDPKTGISMALAFIFGAFCSAIAGYMGMGVAVEANVRTATAAKESLNKAFRLSFYAGSVMGLAMVGLAVIGMSIIYGITKDSQVVLGFSFGASTLALLAKAGGGIYTKTADIAADLVGKVEIGIPEDDPRNPAVVADNVGDNVGDVAGMGADIFDSYVASAVAVMLLGATLPNPDIQSQYTILPLILCTLGIFASLLGIQFVKVRENGKPGPALNRGTIITTVIFGIMVAILVLVADFDISILWATLVGLAAGVIIGFTSDYFTSDAHKPVNETARVSGSGAAINIITGYSYGLISIVPSIIGIVAATLISYFLVDNPELGLSGVYGIGISAVGMLSISGMIVSADAYGPIVDNARGIAEMAGMGQEVIERADVLDSAGNTAKAITKGFSISAAALTVLALFAAYSEVVAKAGSPITISLQDPMVVAGVLLGAMTPPLFSALLMLSVTHNAFDMIEEIRRQFREKPGILAGTDKPDYNTCVGLAAEGALSSLILPAFLAVGMPLLVGFGLGPDALGGFLGGAIFTGVIFALLMANAGGLWDNAKKYIETGKFGGPGSDAHKAAVVGDTVGDPFKDTAGPSLNTLITVMSLVASLFAPIIASFHP